MLYKNNPHRPAMNKIASLPKFLTSESKARKSRRLAAGRVRSGTDNSKANCVRHMKDVEVRRLAASAEKGSCVASNTAVRSEYKLPSR